MLIVSDTTPILSLLKAGRLELLPRLFGSVVIPKAVYNELVRNPGYAGEAEEVEQSDFLKVFDLSDRRTVEELLQKEGLDEGESEAIALAEERRADVLLMDERRGRRAAEKRGIRMTGTIGLLLHTYDEGILSGAEIMECLECLRENNIRMGKSLYAAVQYHLRHSGQISGQ